MIPSRMTPPRQYAPGYIPKSPWVLSRRAAALEPVSLTRRRLDQPFLERGRKP